MANDHRRHWVTCEQCDKRTYQAKSAAKRAARVLHREDHLSIYACPADPESGYHIGNLPAVVKSGRVDRHQLRRPRVSG